MWWTTGRPVTHHRHGPRLPVLYSRSTYASPPRTRAGWPSQCPEAARPPPPPRVAGTLLSASLTRIDSLPLTPWQASTTPRAAGAWDFHWAARVWD